MIEYLGFTGRADGMTPEQHTKLETILRLAAVQRAWICLHNDGEGSDQAFAKLAQSVGLEVETTSSDLRPMPRNRELASTVDLLLATPPTDKPVKGSGSWATIQYALKYGKKVMAIIPNGKVHELEGWPCEELKKLSSP